MSPPTLRDRLRDRYAEILIAKLEADTGVDPSLCDRIEGALGMRAAVSHQRTVGRQPPSTKPALRIVDIVDAVARRYGTTPEAMLGPSRAQPETGARQLAMRLVRELTGKSYAEIGRAFNRDHATVSHACEVAGTIACGDIREELEDAFVLA